MVPSEEAKMTIFCSAVIPVERPLVAVIVVIGVVPVFGFFVRFLVGECLPHCRQKPVPSA